MNISKAIILMILNLMILSSCSKSDDLADKPSNGAGSNITRIDNIEGKIVRIKATTSIQSITIGPIYDSSNQLVKTSDIFALEIQQVGVQIAPSNATDPSSFLTKIDVNPNSSGEISFKAILPQSVGLYSISIKAKTYPSVVGLVYFQVESNTIKSIGTLSSAYFQDLAPYNGIREINEKYSVVNGAETLITIGPIKDQFNNLVSSGNITVYLINAYFGSNYEDEDGENSGILTNIPINNGYINLPVIPLDPTQEVRVVASLSELLQTESDLTTIPPALLVDDSLNVLDSAVQLLGIETKRLFGVVYIGQSKTQTFDLRNLGNSVVSNLSIGVSPPFAITGGTCVNKATLQPQEQCTLMIKFEAQVRSFATSDLVINGVFNGTNINEVREQLFAQAAFPVNLNIVIDNNLIEFPAQPVGELVTKAFTIINTGDVPATNVRFQNPAPYPGQNETFYTLSSLADTVPNDDASVGEHCGNVFEPQRRCKVYVNYYPTAKVGNNILSGSVIVDGLDPISVFVKGPSFVNNFERIIGISSITNSICTTMPCIKKDEIDTLGITVGPIRDLFGATVQNQNIQIQIFRYVDEGQTIKEHLGEVLSPNLIIGGPPNTYIIRTDQNGYANFQLKSRVKDSVGKFVIKVEIIDTDLNVLAAGQADYEFIGAKLLFDLDLYNFAKVVVNKKFTKPVTLKNDGSLDAQNIRVALDDGYFLIENEGTCLGISEGTLSLNAMSSCNFELSFFAQSRTSYFDNMRIFSSTVGNKIPSDVYGVGMSPAKLASETPIFVGTHVVGSSELLKGSIVFSNIGDETATDLSAITELENDSFDFDMTCSTLSSGVSCVLNFEYDPQVIPNQLLNTGLIIQGIGEVAGVGTQLRIPLQILHSSMKFKQTDPGININRCYELQVQAFDTQDSQFDFSQNITLGLDNEGKNGNFYADIHCGVNITEIVMTANSFLTPKFYYKPLESGTHILKTVSNQLASAMKSFTVYKEPVGLQLISGNFQKVYTERQLTQPMIIKVVDEDGHGVPNIPVNIQALDDIKNQTQLIANPNFSSSIAGWTGNDPDAVSWFRGFSGSMKLASTTFIASAVSSSIPVTPNSTYIYAAQVSEVIGSPATSDLKITLINSTGNTVISEQIISGVRIGVFKVKIPNGVTNIKMKLETTGFSRTTATFIESIFFVNDLAPALNNPVKFGTYSPTITSVFDGPGNVVVDFMPGQVPIVEILKVTSTYPTMSSDYLLMSANVEFPTNIQGLFGDLVVSATGPTLIKNGGNNLSELQAISGYSWNATSKILSLPANKVYDFRNITVDANTTLEFKAPADKKLEWTSLYSKESCLINGNIKLKGFQTDGVAVTKNLVGLDNELLSSSLPEYNNGYTGASGGTAGYRYLARERSCKRKCKKSCSVSCGGWTGYYWEGNYNVLTGANGGSVGTKFAGGKGGNGAGVAWGSGSLYRVLAATNGGQGGSKGLDGGVLFMHCFLGVAGSGKIDVAGEPGLDGNNGAPGSYNDYVESCSVGFYGQCVKLVMPRYFSGGAGAGAGGHGGNGGQVFLKSKSLNHDLTVILNGGSAGAGAAGGPSVNGFNNGSNSSSGTSGQVGVCKELDGITNQQQDC